MNSKTLIWLLLAAVLLLSCAFPVGRFVFTHLKEGYDEAERQAATRPATPPAAPATAAPPRPGAVDFGGLDFSGNSTDVHDRADRFAAALPPLHGSARDGWREGAVGQGNFELRGGVASVSGASRCPLPSASGAGGLVTLELAVESGTVRAYLQGLDGHFVSGYVFADASPGRPARVTGYLRDWGGGRAPEQDFVLEARDGDARGVSYRVYRRE